MLSDTEDRINTLNSVNEGIQKTQLALHSLDREIDNKYDTLKRMTQKELQEKGPSKSNTLTPEINSDVRRLKLAGWRVSEIAEKLQLSEMEVELILNLPE